jgi:hypothetical protein
MTLIGHNKYICVQIAVYDSVQRLDNIYFVINLKKQCMQKQMLQVRKIKSSYGK